MCRSFLQKFKKILYNLDGICYHIYLLNYAAEKNREENRLKSGRAGKNDELRYG